MIWFWSFLVALAALIAYVLLFVTVGIRLLVSTPPSLPEGVGYVSNSPWIPLWLILLGALLVFAAAFYGTFRKISGTARRPR
jgi:hypothetical protein